MILDDLRPLLLLFEHTISIDICLRAHFLWHVLLEIGLAVEVEEEEEEHGAVEEDDVAENLGEVAGDEEGEGGVDEKCHELAELHGGEVPGVREDKAREAADNVKVMAGCVCLM